MEPLTKLRFCARWYEQSRRDLLAQIRLQNELKLLGIDNIDAEADVMGLIKWTQAILFKEIKNS